MSTRSMALGCLLALSTAAPMAASEPPGTQQGAMPPGLDSVLEAMSLGPQHQYLARFAGDWTYTAKWTFPGMAATESSGTMHAETTFGGRYVDQQWIGEFMGKPFEARGTEAFDNVTKKFLSTRIELGGVLMVQAGTCDDAMTTCNYSGWFWDTAGGQQNTMRSVITWTGDDRFAIEGYGTGPDGREFKVVEVSTTRKR